MRRKPICSAKPNLSGEPRRASITARSRAEKVKKASISKPLSSHGNRLSPRNIACQWFIAPLPSAPTIDGENQKQQVIVLSGNLKAQRYITDESYRHFWKQ